VTRLHELPTRDDDGNFRVVIEAPRGSNLKLEWDEDLRVFTLSRSLQLGVVYPFDWGFVPSTLAPDGDPLDAMVLLDGATFPGVVVACRALGVVQLRDHEGKKARRNDRVIAVAADDPRTCEWKDVDDLPKRVRDELARFFLTAIEFAEKQGELLGWGSAKTAEKLVDRSARTFAKRRRDQKV
jgi:inorganic pyrophosphatase